MHCTASHSHTALHCVVHSAAQCSTVQCSAVQYSAVQCSAVQYSAVHCESVSRSPVCFPDLSPNFPTFNDCVSSLLPPVQFVSRLNYPGKAGSLGPKIALNFSTHPQRQNISFLLSRPGRSISRNVHLFLYLCFCHPQTKSFNRLDWIFLVIECIPKIAKL